MALHNLRSEAFKLCTGRTDAESLEDWINYMVGKSPTFMFWDLMIRYETLALIFIRAHREKKFDLYIEALEELAPLFFALKEASVAQW